MREAEREVRPRSGRRPASALSGGRSGPVTPAPKQAALSWQREALSRTRVQAPRAPRVQKPARRRVGRGLPSEVFLSLPAGPCPPFAGSLRSRGPSAPPSGGITQGGRERGPSRWGAAATCSSDRARDVTTDGARDAAGVGGGAFSARGAPGRSPSFSFGQAAGP